MDRIKSPVVPNRLSWLFAALLCLALAQLAAASCTPEPVTPYATRQLAP